MSYLCLVDTGEQKLDALPADAPVSTTYSDGESHDS